MPDIQGTQPHALSPATKTVLSKLPPADAVTVMEEMLGKVASSNNSTNFAKGAAELSHEEMVQKLQSLPDGNLKNILQAHGIV